MDNEAFRSLVNQTRKTTKEIAREAVESEFKKRKRKHNDQGYGSDSDDSDADAKQSRRDAKKHEIDDDGGNNGHKQKKEKREKKLEYRDRAKERREGKSVDYVPLDVDITSSSHAPSQHYDGHVTAEEMKKKQAELSKYLGGDEEHTHLVKGLDRVLAQKVRREEMGRKDHEEDFDELMDVAFEKRRETAATAATNDGSLRSMKPKSDLGRSMLNYLLQKEERDRDTVNNLNDTKVKVNPALQKSIQRSILTFSLNSDIRRRKHAWDAPQLSIQAFTDDNIIAQKATPLDRQLITTISNKLNGHLLRVKHENISKDVSQSADNEDLGESTSIGQHGSNKVNSQTKPSPDSDSDDDIFENAGTYIPPTADTTKVNGNNTRTNGGNEDSKPNKNGESKKKQSIFDNLITTSNEVVTTQSQKVQIQAPQKAYNKNVINRDVIGASTNKEEPFTKRRGPQTAAMEGFSMNNYTGGYGEDIDVDFGNFDEDRRTKKKKNYKQEEDNDDDANKEDDNDF